MKILLSCPHFPAFFNAAPRFWPAVEGFCRKPGPLVLPAASPTASLAQSGCGNLWLQTCMGLFRARRMVVRNKRLVYQAKIIESIYRITARTGSVRLAGNVFIPPHAVVVDAKPLCPFAVDLLGIVDLVFLHQFIDHPQCELSDAGAVANDEHEHISALAASSAVFFAAVLLAYRSLSRFLRISRCSSLISRRSFSFLFFSGAAACAASCSGRSNLPIMRGVCGTVLPCDIRRGRCFAMPNRKALFAQGLV